MKKKTNKQKAKKEQMLRQNKNITETEQCQLQLLIMWNYRRQQHLYHMPFSVDQHIIIWFASNISVRNRFIDKDVKVDLRVYIYI